MGLALPKRLRTGGDLAPPVEFADAVEMYARRSGRHATLSFVPPPVNCWVVSFTLRATDSRLAAWQGQAVEEEPKEVVYLWRNATPQEVARGGRQHFVGMTLDEMGVSGLIAFLERTSLTSGRGEYGSLTQATKDQAEKQEQGIAKVTREHRDGAVDLGMEKRRQIMGIPLLPVGIDLTAPTTAQTE